MIRIGGTEITDIALGSIPIERAYMGSQLVWEKSSPALPYDAQVEWLATDGLAYIDTGFKPKNTTRFEIVMDIPTLEQDTWFFGGRNSSSAGQMALFNNGSWSWRFGNKNASNSTTIATGEYTFDNHTSGAPRQLYIKHNNTTLTLTATNNTFTCNYNFYIFTLNVNGGGPSASNMQDGLKCISAKIWDNTTLVRDYIPVRKNGVGYLWDNVTEELYGNARATGAFTYGNDVN